MPAAGRGRQEQPATDRRLLRCLRLACFTLGAIALGGCASSGPVAPNPYVDSDEKPPPPEDVVVPDWVMRTPRMTGNICAVGAVDPTFFRQDGRANASESARSELARTIQVKITTVMYDEQTTHGQFVEQAIVQQVVGSLSDVVLSGAQVMEVWYDAYGNVSRNGMTYALACMKTDESVAQLAERLHQVTADDPDSTDRIARVKENARLAFEELEGMEAQRAEQPADAGAAE